MSEPWKRPDDDRQPEAWRRRQLRNLTPEEREHFERQGAGGGMSLGYGTAKAQIWGRDVVTILCILIMAIFAFAVVWYTRDGHSMTAANVLEVKKQLRRDEARREYEHRLIAYRMNRAECQNSFDFVERSKIRSDRRRGIDRLREECDWIGQEPLPPTFRDNGDTTH